jgi:CRP-like cAMP-binding protein
MKPRTPSTGISSAPETETNRLLAILPDLDTLRPHIERTTYKTGETIYGADCQLTHYVFPTCGIVSSVDDSPLGTVEVGTAGAEGMVGFPALLGVRQNTRHTFAQSLVIAERIAIDTLDAWLDKARGTRAILLRYVAAVHEEASQYVACNRVHSVEERLARWLLLSHDRHGRELMPLTQKFLASMLGVHRPAVSLAAQTLQRAGLIRYSRGHIKVVDRAGLERASCECYASAGALFRDAGLPWGLRAER